MGEGRLLGPGWALSRWEVVALAPWSLTAFAGGEVGLGQLGTQGQDGKGVSADAWWAWPPQDTEKQSSPTEIINSINTSVMKYVI